VQKSQVLRTSEKARRFQAVLPPLRLGRSRGPCRHVPGTGRLLATFRARTYQCCARAPMATAARVGFRCCRGRHWARPHRSGGGAGGNEFGWPIQREPARYRDGQGHASPTQRSAVRLRGHHRRCSGALQIFVDARTGIDLAARLRGTASSTESRRAPRSQRNAGTRRHDAQGEELPRTETGYSITDDVEMSAADMRVGLEQDILATHATHHGASAADRDAAVGGSDRCG